MTDEMEEEFTEDVPVEVEEEECKTCGYVLAGVGILVGVLFLYMSFDVLTGGKLTSVLGLGTARATSDGMSDDA